ncbi:CO or xanthine dehydrogenase, FAD-binding subunit [Microbacterium sp. cf046]|uniref:FAD binding domain-containing protein n=1 Tax=Microbacterium sp. cf046 TaxID=1761803 RepID=UPI0008EFF996|nr:FAD binding domain-containing protein [Microbacterium sp. cf046]SFR89218.1 CO or xanthine dehydrogenase, FAD-binding subunit [Microbacterium sp. cf046]
MDLNTVVSYRFATSRADLILAPGEKVLGGGTGLFAEPRPDVTGIVDLSTMGWPDLEVSEAGLRIAATCTIATLVAFAEGRGPLAVPGGWAAASVFPVAANALLASFKIWNTATVGGNVCQSYCAASMVSLAAALDGQAVIWTPDGGERRQSVASLMTGDGTNSLGAAEVLRAIDLPAVALRSRVLMRKIALAELGRSGAVVTGRVDADATAVFTVTASTLTPTVLRYAPLPDAPTLAAAVGAARGYYTDPLGPADWRRAVSIVLAEELRAELAAGA